VEVLSDATRDYDRGKKLDAYRAIPGLRDVLLIDQMTVAVEHWKRAQETAWTSSAITGLDATIELTAAPVTLPLRDVYRGVFD
jgi:Uma2 family endonuclease